MGLDGFVVLAATESTDELVVTVETTAFIVDCTRCGTRAEAHRMRVDIRDLSCFGRPARLVWISQQLGPHGVHGGPPPSSRLNDVLTPRLSTPANK